MGIDAVTVVNDELVALTTDHTLPELLPCPFRCRMPSHVHLEDASRLDFHDQQHVDDAECSGDDDEEVRCDDCLGMIPHEGHPPLRSDLRPLRMVGHVTANGTRRNLNPDLQQKLIRDSFLTPGRIVRCHVDN